MLFRINVNSKYKLRVIVKRSKTIASFKATCHVNTLLDLMNVIQNYQTYCYHISYVNEMMK